MVKYSEDDAEATYHFVTHCTPEVDTKWHVTGRGEHDGVGGGGYATGLGGTQRGWGVHDGAEGYATGQLHTMGQGQGVWRHAMGCDGVVARNRVGGGGYGWGVRGALGYATGQWHATGGAHATRRWCTTRRWCARMDVHSCMPVTFVHVTTKAKQRGARPDALY